MIVFIRVSVSLDPGEVTLNLSEGVAECPPNIGYAYDAEGWLVLRCPIGVLSHRDGIHAVNPAGKVSVTSFRPLSYIEADNTSVVECRPLTGRTHQIRIHLQYLGNPIANDPCYGGELFFGSEDKKVQALEVLESITNKGIHPLSNISHLIALVNSRKKLQGNNVMLHFNSDGVMTKDGNSSNYKNNSYPSNNGISSDLLTAHNERIITQNNASINKCNDYNLPNFENGSDATIKRKGIPTDDMTKEIRKDDETDEEFLIRTCK